jgi:hypothetical protein
MPSLSTTTKPAEPQLSSDNPSCIRRFKNLDLAMKRNHYRQDALIEVLHQAQATFGYLEADVLLYIARGLKLPPQPRLWCCHLLPPLLPQAVGRTYLRCLSRNYLLCQGGKRFASRDRQGNWHSSRRNYSRWQNIPTHGSLCWCLRDCSGCCA